MGLFSHHLWWCWCRLLWIYWTPKTMGAMQGKVLAYWHFQKSLIFDLYISTQFYIWRENNAQIMWQKLSFFTTSGHWKSNIQFPLLQSLPMNHNKVSLLMKKLVPLSFVRVQSLFLWMKTINQVGSLLCLSFVSHQTLEILFH